MGGNVRVGSGTVDNVLTGATSVSSGNGVPKAAPKSTFQAVLTGTGALTATVVIEGSNDGTNWVATALGTISLSGNDAVSDGFANDAPWKYVRARVTAITGTSATVTVLMGR
jgi:hypothetical protein